MKIKKIPYLILKIYLFIFAYRLCQRWLNYHQLASQPGRYNRVYSFFQMVLMLWKNHRRPYTVGVGFWASLLYIIKIYKNKPCSSVRLSVSFYEFYFIQFIKATTIQLYQRAAIETIGPTFLFFKMSYVINIDVIS